MMLALSLSMLVVATPPLSLDELYGNRLLFADDGRPLVAVRMMEGRERVEVMGPVGMVVRVGGSERTLSAGTTVVVELIDGKPAVMQRGLVLETLEGEQRQKREETRARWTQRGFDVRLESAGAVYGMQGTVFDNRAIQVVVDEDRPDARIKEVFEKYGVRPIVKEWLLAMPTARLRVNGSGTPVVVKDLVEILPPTPADVLVVRGVEHSRGYDAHGFEDRELHGTTVLVVDQKGKVAVVNVVHEEVLVAGILPSEMFATAPMDTLKAQAVTARGELFAKIGQRHLADPYLVCSEQHCQVYKGRTAEHPRTNEAAKATAGELAFKDGRLVDSVYSACCGGHTEPNAVVWDQPQKSALIGVVDAAFSDPDSRTWHMPEPWIAVFGNEVAHSGAGGAVLPTLSAPLDMREERAVRAFLELPRASAFCGASSFNQKGDVWRWTRRLTVDELTARFADTGIGRVTRVAVEERGPGGRLRALLVEGTTGKTRVFRELPVRQKLGNLRSGLFVVDEERDGAGALMAVTLRGGGFGHGSGMCQQGAIGMAEQGYTYREILRHYFNGAEVRKIF